MQKLKSLVRFLFSSQVFNVVFLIVIAAMFAWAVQIDIQLDNFGRGISLVGFAVFVGANLAYATVLGSYRKYPLGDWVSAAVALTGAAFTFLTVGNYFSIWGSQTESDVFAKIHSWLQPQSVVYLLVVVGAYGGLVFLYQFLLGYVANKFYGKRRVAVLVAIGVCLIVGTVIKNGVDFLFPFLLEQASVFAIASEGLLIVIAVAVFFSGTPRRGRRMLIGAALFGLLCLGGLAAQLMTQKDISVPLFVFLLGVPSLLLPLVWISPECDRSDSAERRSSNMKGFGVLLFGRMSLLAIVIALPLIAAGFVMNEKQQLVWQLNRSSVKINFEERYRDAQNPRGLIVRSIEFNMRSAPDALRALTANVGWSYPVELVNLNRRIDLKNFKNTPAGTKQTVVRIEGGELTDVQLNDLVQVNPYLVLSGVDFIDTGQTKVSSGLTQSLQLESLKPGETSELLNVYENANWFQITDCDFNEDDWNAVVRTAKLNVVGIRNVRLPDGMLDKWQPKSGDALWNIHIVDDKRGREGDASAVGRNPLGLNPNNARRLILEHGMGWRFVQTSPNDLSTIQDEVSLFWISGQHVWNRVGYCLDYSDVGIVDSPSENKLIAEENWIVSVTKEGNPEFIFSPWLFDKFDWLPAYPELKKLVVDLTVVYPAAFTGSSWPFDASDLGEVTQLEFLQLFFEYKPHNLEFLGKLPNLKTLVISAEREHYDQPGFEQCLALEKLTLLTSPSAEVIKEIGEIKTLKEIVIVDRNYQYEDEELQERIRKWLKNVNVTFVDPANLELDFPPELIEHRKNMQEKSLEYFFGEPKE